MTWPGAWSLGTPEMQMHWLLRWCLFHQELEINAVDCISVPVFEQHPRTLLVAFIPADDRADVPVQVDLVI